MSSVALGLSQVTDAAPRFAQERANEIPASDARSLPVASGNEPPLPPATPHDTVTLSATGFPSASPRIPNSQGFAQSPAMIAPAFVALTDPVFYPPESFGKSSTAGTTSSNGNAVPARSPSNPVKREDLSNTAASNPNSNTASGAAPADDEPTNAATAQTSGPIAQESLQQLDRTLQQIGINPQSISLIRRVELLSFANDPLALEQYFRTPPAGTAEVSRPSSTTAAPAPTYTVSSKSGPDPLTAGPSQAQPQATTQGKHLNISA